MAATSKFDFYSGSHDRPTYPGGQRGTHSAASLSGNYHEGMENRVLTAVPSMSKDTATDVLKFFHGLRFDSKQLVGVNKLPRQGDLKRVVTATLGIAQGNLMSSSLSTKQQPISSLEELKQVKINLHDNSIRARDRVKTLNETASKFDKCFQNILKKKQSRSDASSTGRANSLSTDHTVFGGTAEMGTESQISAFDTEMSKSEEKIKYVGTTKRPRTSVLDVQMDVRANALGRSRGSVQRAREIPGSANTIQSEEKDQLLANCIDNREKSSVKKRRSGIKSEVCPSTYLNRPLDSDQESAKVIQQRLNTDGKSRFGTPHGFRSTSRGDYCSSPSLTTNTSTVTRAPRSGPGAIPKVSPSVRQSKGVADEELSQDLTELHSGVNSQKHTSSVRLSSQPVGHWAGQRHHKIPRAARGSNLVPSLLDRDETPALDTDSNISGSDNGLGLQRHSSSNSLQQVKVKGENFSSAPLSESEESGVAKIMSKSKSKKSVDMDEKGGQNVSRRTTQVLPSRKNKLLEEELRLGGGIRRQGRTVRGISSTRSGNPLPVEKRENTVTAKQLRSSRLSLDKIESKTGHPPSNSRIYPRPRPSVNAGVPGFDGEADDWHEELLIAANASLGLGKAFSSTFWRQMESTFGPVSSEDIAYIKQQGDSLPSPIADPALEDGSTSGEFGFGFIRDEGDDAFGNEAESVDHFLDQSVPGKTIYHAPSLFQRILSAFIIEEEDKDICGRGEEDFELDVYGSRYVSDMEFKCDSWNQRSLGHIQTVGRPASNGYRITATQRYLDEQEDGDLFDCADVMADTNVEAIPNYGHFLNGFHQGQTLMSSSACTRSQYNQMSIDERLLLEIQSIGLLSGPMGECEDISEDIHILQKKLYRQVLKNKELLCNLEKSVAEARNIQEMEIEHRAMDKLVGLAYEKYMNCWGPNASCGKGMSGKIAKQAALCFLKQTIEQCHKFENTGESCFNEAVFKDVFCSLSPLVKNAESIVSKKERDPPNSLSVTDPASSASVTIPSLISRSGQNMDSNKKYSSEDFQSLNHCSEQILGKDDTASNRMKKRELFLNGVVSETVGTTIRGPSCSRSSLLSAAKGKRSERDKEGKNHNKDMQSRIFTVKTGRPSLGNVKGERKSKAKPKQRTAQLSISVGKTQEIPSIQESREVLTKRSAKKNDDLALDTLPYSEVIDLSNLQLPEMDALGVPDDLGEQGQDLSSWLNIGDDVLQDDEFMGLEIPMDDLSDLKMIV